MKIINLRLISTVILTCLLTAVSFYAVFSAASYGKSRNSLEEQAVQIKKLLQKASVQCYALEGQYPPDAEYLARNYGVILDGEKFYVYYECIGSNVPPEIIVAVRPER